MTELSGSGPSDGTLLIFKGADGRVKVAPYDPEVVSNSETAPILFSAAGKPVGIEGVDSFESESQEIDSD